MTLPIHLPYFSSQDSCQVCLFDPTYWLGHRAKYLCSLLKIYIFTGSKYPKTMLLNVETKSLLLTVCLDAGTYIVLRLDASLLEAEVKFEMAAPVGDKSANKLEGAVLFPHLYGTINFNAVVDELIVERLPDGSFVRIEGISE